MTLFLTFSQTYSTYKNKVPLSENGQGHFLRSERLGRMDFCAFCLGVLFGGKYRSFLQCPFYGPQSCVQFRQMNPYNVVEVRKYGQTKRKHVQQKGNWCNAQYPLYRFGSKQKTATQRCEEVVGCYALCVKDVTGKGTTVDNHELAECFAGIVSENRTGNPKGVRFPTCRKCNQWVRKTRTCTLYPEGIPGKIFWGKEICKGE